LGLGFTSITFNGSFLPLERNIALTAEAVRLAAGMDGRVEGEIGAFGDFGRDGAGNCLYDELAERFARETGIAGLTVTLSPDQGDASPLNPLRLVRLRGRLACSISLHDACLLSAEDISLAVDSGVDRLSFSSCLQAEDTGRWEQARSGPMPGRVTRQRLRLMGLPEVPRDRFQSGLPHGGRQEEES
jgi:fructose/tagatose bisphosphate aldolase